MQALRHFRPARLKGIPSSYPVRVGQRTAMVNRFLRDRELKGHDCSSCADLTRARGFDGLPFIKALAF